MKTNRLFSNTFVLLALFAVTFHYEGHSQNVLYNCSFEANQGYQSDAECANYYHILKEGATYRLTSKDRHILFEEAYDTIVKNAFFIKTVKADAIEVYRCKNLEKIEIPNLKQVYFERDGLEVLTSRGAQYYDNSITKISAFPKLDNFFCGMVFTKDYELTYSKKNRKIQH